MCNKRAWHGAITLPDETFVKHLLLWLLAIMGCGLTACAAPPVAAIQPMLIPAPQIEARPSVTPLPTAQPPERFIRPAGSPTPTGFVILSGPTLAPEVLAAFNAVPVTPTPLLANLNPSATPTEAATIPPSATATAVLAAVTPSATPSAQLAFNPSATAQPTATRPVVQSSATPQPSATATRAVAQASPTPQPSATATRPVAVITPTVPAGWQFQQGRITAPVLLYHRIQAPLDPTRQSPRYSVPPETFEAQLKAFKAWGYTSITISQLAEAIRNGAPLPRAPSSSPSTTATSTYMKMPSR